MDRGRIAFPVSPGYQWPETYEWKILLMGPLFHSLLAYVLLASALQRSPWGLVEPVSLLLIVMALLVAAAGSYRPRLRFLHAVVLSALSAFTVVELILLYRAPMDRVPASIAAMRRDAWAGYESLSMLLIIAVLLSAAVGMWLSMRRRLPEHVAWTALGAFTVMELSLLYLSPTESMPFPITVILIVVGCVVMSYGWTGMPGGRYRFPIIVGLYLLLGGSMVHGWNPPPIDVWQFQQEAAGRLLSGENPYASEYGNHADAQFYGADMVKNGKVQSFPYPPLSLLLALPGYLEGDVRWSLLVATAVSASFMVAAGRRLGVPPGHAAEMAAAAILYHPRELFVLQMSWTEPFLFLAICVSAWAIAGPRQTIAGFALAAAATVKQYGVVWILPAWSTGRLPWRKMIPGAVAAGLLMLPFLLWDPKAFWRGTVHFQISGPFRPDSLTVLSAVYLLTGTRLPSALGFIAAILMTWFVIRRPTKDLATAVLGEAAILLAFFAFNKVGDMNYYWLINAVLALALVVSAAGQRAVEATELAIQKPRG